jgi:hypothetical protein
MPWRLLLPLLRRLQAEKKRALGAKGRGLMWRRERERRVLIFKSTQRKRSIKNQMRKEHGEHQPQRCMHDVLCCHNTDRTEHHHHSDDVERDVLSNKKSEHQRGTFLALTSAPAS